MECTAPNKYMCNEEVRGTIEQILHSKLYGVSKNNGFKLYYTSIKEDRKGRRINLGFLILVTEKWYQFADPFGGSFHIISKEDTEELYVSGICYGETAGGDWQDDFLTAVGKIYKDGGCTILAPFQRANSGATIQTELIVGPEIYLHSGSPIIRPYVPLKIGVHVNPANEKGPVVQKDGRDPEAVLIRTFTRNGTPHSTGVYEDPEQLEVQVSISEAYFKVEPLYKIKNNKIEIKGGRIV